MLTLLVVCDNRGNVKHNMTQDCRGSLYAARMWAAFMLPLQSCVTQSYLLRRDQWEGNWLLFLAGNLPEPVEVEPAARVSYPAFVSAHPVYSGHLGRLDQAY